MTEYEFFFAQGPEGKFQEASRAIRSRAMKTTRRVKSGQACENVLKQATTSSEQTAQRKDELKGRFRLPRRRVPTDLADSSRSPRQTARAGPANEVGFEINRSQQATSANLVQVSCTLSDPFQSLPVPHTRAVDFLIKYFLTDPGLNVRTVDAQRSWFTYALESALVMHGVLAISAVFWTANVPSPDFKVVQEGFHHKGEVIRAIGTRLRTQVTGKDVTTEVITGVASLAYISLLEGDFVTAALHLEGMKDAGAARAKEKYPAEEDILCRFCTCVDVTVAAALGRTPTYPPGRTSQDIFIPPDIIEHAMWPSLSHIAAIEDNNALGAHTTQAVFTALRQLARLRCRPDASPNSITALAHVTSRSIVEYLYGGAPRSGRLATLLLAAQVYLYRTVQALPPTDPVIKVLVGRLSAAFQEAAAAWFQHAAALLWVSAVGLGSAVDGSTQHRQFLVMFAGGVGIPRQKGILRTREDLKRILGTFLWDDDLFQPILDDVYIKLPKSLPP
ncbi:hypothetical protein GQ53DRAFT_838150 [Thozetella sp. PMI_491]|nr:hypothetical protein GQ53DRAFT_838150 [Thozetella sp. PMI_491]